MSSRKQLLEFAHGVFYNVNNRPMIALRMANYGYGPERMQVGMTHLHEAETLVQACEEAELALMEMSQSFQNNTNETRDHFQSDFQIAARAFRQRGIVVEFMEAARGRLDTYEYLQAKISLFYPGLNKRADLKALVEKLGLTQVRIDAGIHAEQTLKIANWELIEQEANLRTLIRQRNDAIELLAQWISDFRQIAHVAFASAPEHLRTLGIEPRAYMKKRIDRRQFVLPVEPPTEESPSGRPASVVEQIRRAA